MIEKMYDQIFVKGNNKQMIFIMILFIFGGLRAFIIGFLIALPVSQCSQMLVCLFMNLKSTYRNIQIKKIYHRMVNLYL